MGSTTHIPRDEAEQHIEDLIDQLPQKFKVLISNVTY